MPVELHSRCVCIAGNFAVPSRFRHFVAYQTMVDLPAARRAELLYKSPPSFVRSDEVGMEPFIASGTAPSGVSRDEIESPGKPFMHSFMFGLKMTGTTGRTLSDQQAPVSSTAISRTSVTTPAGKGDALI